MVKTVKSLLYILLLVSSLFGASAYMDTLKEYDSKISTANSDVLLRIHHDLKNIYIKAIVSNDDALKKEVLRRLVKSSNKLNLDDAGYQRELQTLNKTSPTSPPVSKEKVIPQEDATKPAVKTSSKKETNEYSGVLRKLKKFSNKGDFLLLEFDKPVSNKAVNRFALKSKNSIREVFDINGILPFDPKIQTPSELRDIRIAQYNKKKLRLVLERTKSYKSRIAVQDNVVRIYYGGTKASASKTIISPPRRAIASDKIIVIDAGHGGKDPGATMTKKYYEKHAVLSLALKAGRLLKKRGYKVFYTRTKDKFIRLRDRAKYANRKNADLFLSIHVNAAASKSLHGVETYFLSPARSKRSKNVAALENKSDIEEMNYFSRQTFLNFLNRAKIIQANKLALDVQQGMLNHVRSKYGGVRDGGVREAPFWVLVGAQMPAILIEAGYITNARDRVRVFNGHYQNLLAQGIADGIDSYFMKNE